uniref:DRBM domain-containing protein n=1 Tax=Setaria digitata TaxID=48799 RepID=A0A915Q3A8_9BILA
MVDKLYDVFTHVDVLKSREPEYFICKEPIVLDVDNLKTNKKNEKTGNMDDANEQVLEILPADGGTSTLPTELGYAPVKTFVSILEEGCKKYYDGTPPVFTSALIEMLNSFSVRCELYGNHTVGQGRTKKIAKQMAAKEMLKKLIEKESFSDFGLGKTKEEALASLENLMVDFHKRGNTDDTIVENWVGKLNERCQKLKLSNAIYEINEEGPPNQRIFNATCKIGKVHVVAHGKTKKIAKTLAAQKMCSQLGNWKDLAEDAENIVSIAAEEDTNRIVAAKNEGENVFDASPGTALYPQSLQKVRAAFQDGFGAKGLTKKLNELIKSGDENINRVFLNQELDFVFLSPDLDGNTQCMLSIDGPNGAKNVFYGFGATESDAKDYASRNALIHLELFVRTSEPSRSFSDHSSELLLIDGPVPAINFPEGGIQDLSSQKQ